MQFLGFNMTKLISHKIWVAVKSWNSHTVRFLHLLFMHFTHQDEIKLTEKIADFQFHEKKNFTILKKNPNRLRFLSTFYAHMLRMKKNSSLCQWFGTRICTIVPSIKAAMRRNNVQVFRIHFFVHSLHSVEETKIWKYFVKLIFCFTVCCFLDSRNFRQSNIESQI